MRQLLCNNCFMPRLPILADDLTDALDTGVQFAKKGIDVRVCPSPERAKQPLQKNPMVLVINIGTRHSAPDEARRVIAECAAVFSDVEFFYKKTDSCLRGNIDAELEALMRASGVRQLPFVPAYPGLERITRGGVQYINDQPVHESAMAKDPLNPVTESFVPAIIKKQSTVQCRVISALCITEQFPVADTAGEPIEEILIFDCESNEEMNAIAGFLKNKKLLEVTAGCAGFAEAWADTLVDALTEIPPSAGGKKIPPPTGTDALPLLIVTGSLHPVSINQIRTAVGKGASLVPVSEEELLEPDWPQQSQADALASDCVAALDSERLCILGTEMALGLRERFETSTPPVSETGSVAGGWAGSVSGRLGKLLPLIAEKSGPFKLAIFGGDTLLGVMEALDCNSLCPREELLLGIAVSTAENFSGAIITKSGAFGEIDLIARLVQYS